MKKVLKVVATFIATLLMCCFACFSCNSKAQVRVEPAEMSASQLIMFEFYNIEDAIYSKDSMNFYLEYMDVDAFDLEAMAYRAGLEEWPTDYLVVTISENLIDEFLEDWNRYEYLGSSKEEWEEKFQLSYKYALKEYYIGNIPNFKIVKVDGDWFSGEPVIVEE